MAAFIYLTSLISEISIFHDPVFWSYVLRFGYNTLVIFILSYFFYFKNKGKDEFLYSYMILGAIIFQLCILLKNVPLELGFALGLFAVFGIIRYRTVPILPREMTYLFVTVGISAANGLLKEPAPYDKMIVSDILLFSIAFGGELFINRKKLSSKLVIFEKIELLEEDRRDELKQELQKRLGLMNIKKIKVGKVDFLKNVARLMIYFEDSSDENFEDN